MVKLTVKTTLANALDKLPAPLIAWLINRRYVDGWPLELTRLGKRRIRVVFRNR